MTDKNANSLLDTVKSVGAAFIGVQSEKNRQQDFKHGKLSHFIIVGVIAVIVFIGVLVVAVSFVMPTV